MSEEKKVERDERVAFEAEWKRSGWGDADTKNQCFHFWQARAASTSANVAQGAWQPIEIAPKDGTKVLLSNGLVVAQGEWINEPAYIKEHRDLEGRYIGQDEFDGFEGWIDFIGGMMPEPTHWMPLPAEPESGEQK